MIAQHVQGADALEPDLSCLAGALAVLDEIIAEEAARDATRTARVALAGPIPTSPPVLAEPAPVPAPVLPVVTLEPSPRLDMLEPADAAEHPRQRPRLNAALQLLLAPSSVPDQRRPHRDRQRYAAVAAQEGKTVREWVRSETPEEAKQRKLDKQRQRRAAAKVAKGIDQ